MNNVEKLYQQHASSPQKFAGAYLDYLSQVLAKLDRAAIASFIQAMLEKREKEAQIFFIGNGGSAATASHFANDIAIGSRAKRKPFKAIALTDNMAIVTAVGNDYGYEEIFTKQLENFLRPGDMVVAISASGNSPNVVKAIEFAKQRGATTVGLTGFDGGKLRQMVDIALHVDCPKGEYGPVEDVHMIFDHLCGAYFMQLCRHEA